LVSQSSTCERNEVAGLLPAGKEIDSPAPESSYTNTSQSRGKQFLFVYYYQDEPSAPPYEERLVSVRAENGVGPHDELIELTIRFI